MDCPCHIVSVLSVKQRRPPAERISSNLERGRQLRYPHYCSWGASYDSAQGERDAGHPLPADRTSNQLAATLQHRADNYDQYSDPVDRLELMLMDWD